MFPGDVVFLHLHSTQYALTAGTDSNYFQYQYQLVHTEKH